MPPQIKSTKHVELPIKIALVAPHKKIHPINQTMLATSAAARSLLARAASRAAAPALGSSLGGATRSFASVEPYADYGKSVFTGRVADEYLKKHGSSADILDDPSWVKTHSDTVAQAVLDW